MSLKFNNKETKITFRKSKTPSILYNMVKVLSLFILLAFVSINTIACSSTFSGADSEPEEIPEEILYIQTEEFTAKYLRHEVIRNFHYRDVLAVYFEFTNTNFKSAKSFVYAFDCDAIQNERRLKTSSYDLEGLDNDFSKNIRRGKTTTGVYILYNLYDNSEVELKLSSVSSDGIYEDSMIIPIE